MANAYKIGELTVKIGQQLTTKSKWTGKLRVVTVSYEPLTIVKGKRYGGNICVDRPGVELIPWGNYFAENTIVDTCMYQYKGIDYPILTSNSGKRYIEVVGVKLYMSQIGGKNIN